MYPIILRCLPHYLYLFILLLAFVEAGFSAEAEFWTADCPAHDPPNLDAGNSFRGIFIRGVNIL